MKREHLTSTAIDAVFMVVTFGGIILMLFVWGKTTYERQPPAIEYVTVEVPAAPLVQTVVVERVITATPEPTLQNTIEPTENLENSEFSTPTPTEQAVDFALLVSVDMPAEIITGRAYRAVVTVQNAGNKTWTNYGVSCPVGLVLIPELAPGAQFVASFDFVAGGSSFGQYEAFEFVVLNSQAERVPWLPVGGLGAPSPVVGVRTIGYKPTPPSGRKLKTIVEGVLGKGWEACPPGG